MIRVTHSPDTSTVESMMQSRRTGRFRRMSIPSTGSERDTRFGRRLVIALLSLLSHTQLFELVKSFLT